jgi:hypothetical protein
MSPYIGMIGLQTPEIADIFLTLKIFFKQTVTRKWTYPEGHSFSNWER